MPAHFPFAVRFARSLAAAGAIVLAFSLDAKVKPAAPSPEAMERSFAEQTASIIIGSNVRRAGGLKVAVAGNPRNFTAARSAADLIKGAADRTHPELKLQTVVMALPDRPGLTLEGISAVIIIDTGPLSLRQLEAAAVAAKVLTISRRPQDIGLVSVVILPTGEMYRFGERLREEGIVLPAQTIRRMTEVRPARYEDAYDIARTLQMEKSTNWVEIVTNLRMALTARPTESRTPVRVANGTINDPYVPYFFLGEALAMIGDCEGAMAAFKSSDVRKRVALKQPTVQRVTNAVTSCPHTRKAVSQQAEDQWATASF